MTSPNPCKEHKSRQVTREKQNQQERKTNASWRRTAHKQPSRRRATNGRQATEQPFRERLVRPRNTYRAPMRYEEQQATNNQQSKPTNSRRLARQRRTTNTEFAGKPKQQRYQSTKINSSANINTERSRQQYRSYADALRQPYRENSRASINRKQRRPRHFLDSDLYYNHPPIHQGPTTHRK